MGLFSRVKTLGNINGEALADVKKQLGMLTQLCQNFDKEFQDGDLTEVFISDLVNYCLMLASADGVVDPCEVELINMLFGTDLSKSQAQQMVREFQNKLGADRVLSTPPASFMFFVLLSAANDDPEFAAAVFMFYGMVGAFVIGADGEKHPNEEAMMKMYLDNLVRCLD